MRKLTTLLMAFVMLVGLFTAPASIYAEETTTTTETELTKLQWLDRLGVIDEADARFAESNLANQCTLYDLNEILNIYNGTPDASNAESNKTSKMTQGNIVKKFNQALGISGSYIANAQSAGLITDADGFTADGDAATYSHLLNLAVNAICFDADSSADAYEFPVFKTLLESGNVKIGELELDDYATADMLKFYHYDEKKLPATAVEGIDGRTYYFIDYYGEMIYRPYFTQPHWSNDGKSFLFMTAKNKKWNNKNTQNDPRDVHMYMYNTETQQITYLDDCCGHNSATIADGYVYYIKVIDWTGTHWEEMWRVKIDGTEEPEWLLTFPRNIAAGMPHVTNDGMYASFELANNNKALTGRYDQMSRLFPDKLDGTKIFTRLRIGGDMEYEERPLLKEDYTNATISSSSSDYEFECYGANFVIDDYNYYSFDHSNSPNHVQINPEYPDMFFFAHEGEGGNITATEGGPIFNYRNILDRSNIMDITTGEVTRIPQGQMTMTLGSDSYYHDIDYSKLFFTHESWSADGEVLNITCLGADSETNVGGGVIQVNKDGSHRKFYHADETLDYNTTNHSTITGDNRYAVADNTYVSVLSLETNQLFPICQLSAKKTKYTYDAEGNVTKTEQVNAVSLGHPYHAHVTAARNAYIACWGMVLEDNGPLGVAWYDFSSIDDTDLATGGRYSVSDSVDNVRYSEPRADYPAMPCDTDAVTKDGKTALYAETGEKVYLDIKENIIDEVNGSVNITFDYFDDSTQPLILTYTKGVETDNDWCEYDNKSLTINRSGSNTWKTTTVNIPSGNFETIGRYDTDFNIAGNNSACYIANVSVENASALNTGDIQLAAIADNGSGYTIKGEIKKNNTTVNSATILASARNVEPVTENYVYADFSTDGTITTKTNLYNSEGTATVWGHTGGACSNATISGGVLTVGNGSAGRLLLEPKTPFNTGTYRVKFDFMTPDTGDHKANLKIYGNTAVGQIYAHSPETGDGSETVWYDNKGHFKIASNTWYDFECIFDLDAGTYSMTINDTVVKTGTFTPNTTIARIFDNDGGIGTRTIKYDNLIIDELTDDIEVRFDSAVKKVNFGTDSYAKFELDLEAQSGSEINFFVFNDITKLSPIGMKLNVMDMSLSAESMANGVKLTWDAVEGASSYTIFKDGKKLATTTAANYDDKYFSTVEQLVNDHRDQHTTPHTYIIESNNGYVSTSVEACANTSLIHYVDYGVALTEDPNATGYTGTYKDNLEKTVASFGDSAVDEYTIMLCAQRATVSNQSVFAVKDASGNWKTLPYADGANEEFTVYYGHTSHPLIVEPAIDFSHTASAFPTTTYSTSNDHTYTKWNTYVFDINACFNDAEPNFKILQNSDGTTYPVVRKVGFVKSEYYLK